MENKKYGVNYVLFWDELSFNSRKRMTDLVDAILESDFKFYWAADIRSNLFTNKDVDLLKRAKESGCVSLAYSLESGNEEILISMNKKVKVENFVRQTRLINAAGIKAYTSLVLGYPQETLETIKETFDQCLEAQIYPSAGYLLPQPGTPIFDVAKERGLVPDMEEYLMGMGDRQDLRYNLTNIPNDVFQEEVKKHLVRLSNELNLGISEEKVIKTGHYQGKTQKLDKHVITR